MIFFLQYARLLKIIVHKKVTYLDITSCTTVTLITIVPVSNSGENLISIPHLQN